MSKGVRISEAALHWIELEAERIAEVLGRLAAEEFRNRIDTAVRNVADFPHLAKRGKLPGSRTITVHRRTVLTIVERDGVLVVAAARSHRQGDAFEPHETHATADDKPDPAGTPKL